MKNIQSRILIKGLVVLISAVEEEDVKVSDGY